MTGSDGLPPVALAPAAPVAQQKPQRASDTDGAPEVEAQLLFFVRHAESRWNRAQADYSLAGMYCENDHGLTVEGQRQAEALRQRIAAARSYIVEGGPDLGDAPAWERPWLKRLLQPEHVLTSPFTRAIETAVIALPDVLETPRVASRLTVAKEAREQKTFGGADSRGIATGEGIRPRVEEELRTLCAEAGVSDEELLQQLTKIELDVADCQEDWWPTVMDTEACLEERDAEFIAKLRGLGSGSAAVIVGHSYFFRRFFQAHLSARARREQPEISDSLSGVSMPVCGIVGMRVEWDVEGCASITEAVPLLGTGLMPNYSATNNGGALSKALSLHGCCSSRRPPPPPEAGGPPPMPAQSGRSVAVSEAEGNTLDSCVIS